MSETTVKSARGGRSRKVASRAVDRAMARRRAVYEQEVARLVDASFKLIRDTGNLEPRVSEIVAEAGLSNQAFYKHFRSKDELLLAVLDEGSQILKEYLERKMQRATTAEDKVRYWIDGMLEQVINEEAASATRPFAMSRARLSELFAEEVLNSEKQLTEILRRAIEEAKQSGAMPDADPDRDSEIINNMVLGWVERKISVEPRPDQADVEHLIEFVVSGLKRGL